MARNKFRGDAQAVAQVTTFMITAAGSAGDTWTVTVNDKVVRYVVQSGDTTTTVAAGIAAQCAAAQITEFQEIVFTSAGAVVICTAASPGTPFTVAGVSTDGAGTVGSITAATASRGPSHWDDPNNWSLAAVPVTGDDVDLQDCAVDIKFGISQSGVTLASLNVYSTFTGKIGLPAQTGSYYEYRPRYLAIGATNCTIGAGQGSGSGRVYLDFGTVQVAGLILNSSTSGQQGSPAISLKGTNASNVLTVSGGDVGIAADLGAAMTVATLTVSVGGNAPPTVQYGAGATIGTVNHLGGKLFGLAGATAVTQDGGEITLGGLATLNVGTYTGRAGTLYYDATGTITTANLYGAVLNCERDGRAKTVTNLTCYAGSSFFDQFKKVSLPNGVVCPDGADAVTLRLGEAITLSRS